MLFILFSFLTSSFSFLSLCPFSSDSNASLCLGKYKSIHSLKLNVAVIFFHLQMLSLFFFNTDCSLVLIISCCLNPNLDLNSIAVGILQSNIIDKARSSRKYIHVKPAKFLFHIFFICSFVRFLVL